MPKRLGYPRPVYHMIVIHAETAGLPTTGLSYVIYAETVGFSATGWPHVIRAENAGLSSIGLSHFEIMRARHVNA